MLRRRMRARYHHIGACDYNGPCKYYDSCDDNDNDNDSYFNDNNSRHYNSHCAARSLSQCN
jgi:hypothetical protein